MQQMIDANVLRKNILDAYEYEFPTASGAFDEFVNKRIPQIISNAPAVDAVPVVYGHWIKVSGMMPPEYFGKHACSVCDHFAPNYFHGTHEWLTPICPCCGAKMSERKGR